MVDDPLLPDPAAAGSPPPAKPPAPPKTDTTDTAPASTVAVKFMGTHAQGVDAELRIDNYVLPLGVSVNVPADIAARLTAEGSDNKRLYNIETGA